MLEHDFHNDLPQDTSQHTPADYGTIQNIVNMTGAADDNYQRADSGDPWAPWSAQVMILAGVADGQAWLWLGCRNCGWFLGYSPQIDPGYLADAAARHRDACPESGAAGSRYRLPDGTWSCTRDGVTEPCGDCDGCRHIAAINLAPAAAPGSDPAGGAR